MRKPIYFKYKGKDYRWVAFSKMKVGFWFWRRWVDAIIYRSEESEELYVREHKEFYKRFKSIDY